MQGERGYLRLDTHDATAPLARVVDVVVEGGLHRLHDFAELVLVLYHNTTLVSCLRQRGSVVEQAERTRAYVPLPTWF